MGFDNFLGKEMPLNFEKLPIKEIRQIISRCHHAGITFWSQNMSKKNFGLCTLREGCGGTKPIADVGNLLADIELT
jgi:hypothetical protein